MFLFLAIPEDLLDVIGDKQICYLVNDYDKQCNHTCNHVSHDISDNEKEKDPECGKQKKKNVHNKSKIFEISEYDLTVL